MGTVSTYNIISRRRYSDTSCTQTYPCRTRISRSQISPQERIGHLCLMRLSVLVPIFNVSLQNSSHWSKSSPSSVGTAGCVWFLISRLSAQTATPRNVGLHNWDMKTDVPKESKGVYDIVHVRNVVFVLSDQGIEDILSKVFGLISMTVPSWNRPLMWD